MFVFQAVLLGKQVHSATMNPSYIWETTMWPNLWVGELKSSQFHFRFKLFH